MIVHSVKAFGRVFISLMLLVLMVGCANPNLDELQQYVNERKALPPGRIEPLPEIKQISTFVYEAQGRRDPFVESNEDGSQETGLVEGGISPDFNRRREELESYTLDAIRMVGILEQSGVTWGLVKTKEGTIHRVKTGNYMGQNHGRIIQITEDKIELTEIVQDGTGGYSERQASLALAE
jgi:type IV pilus assembly protein PilP